jgi:hypothetical protein
MTDAITLKAIALFDGVFGILRFSAVDEISGIYSEAVQNWLIHFNTTT